MVTTGLTSGVQNISGGTSIEWLTSAWMKPQDLHYRRWLGGDYPKWVEIESEYQMGSNGGMIYTLNWHSKVGSNSKQNSHSSSGTV